MSKSNQTEIIGPAFTENGMLEARNRTMAALDVIAERIQVGMNEEEGERVARKTLKELGLLLGWHKVVIRFGCNTMLEYGAPSVPDIVLQDNDIFTLDIGPIWQGWEGDGGNTYVVGNHPEMLRAKRDVKVIWDDIQTHWRETQANGEALYEYAATIAKQKNWIFNPIMAGHRVADFPHMHPGRLSDLSSYPTTHRWILEVLIQHATLPFGAYYEDLLISHQV